MTMAMADYEPASGTNLPAGCFERDIDAHFAEQPTCGGCRYAIEMVCDFCVCSRELSRWGCDHYDSDFEQVAEWIADNMHDMQEDSCKEFRE